MTALFHEHIDRHYERELEEIRDHVMRMGTEVCGMLTRTLHALVSGDHETATATIARDKAVNALEVETDELCLSILARRQPVASDLRVIATALKLDTDLERIGDLCVSACERILLLRDELDSVTVARFTDIGARVHAMIESALQAFATSDALLAEAVIDADQTVDRNYVNTSTFLFEQMQKRPASIEENTHLLSIGRFLERMGDHATNLAEMVIFMVDGQDVRHQAQPHEARAAN